MENATVRKDCAKLRSRENVFLRLRLHRDGTGAGAENPQFRVDVHHESRSLTLVGRASSGTESISSKAVTLHMIL